MRLELIDGGYQRHPSSYLNIVENRMDPAHTTLVHKQTIGHPDAANHGVKMERSDEHIVAFGRGPSPAADAPAGMDVVASLLPEGISGREALLPLLHAVMAAFGYVDDALVPAIARTLNLSRADVHGVVTFYHDFRRRPPGRRIIRICRAESCRARGAMAVERALVAGSGVSVGTTATDGSLTIDRVHCFGLCATGPNLEVDGRLLSRVRPDDIAGLLARGDAQ